jgi:predicted RND superfamily exporter protein
MNLDWVAIKAAAPGIIMVAVLAFPMLFFPSWHFAFRLFAACVSVLVGLGAFALFIGHQFEFLRSEDRPILMLGVGLACLIAAAARAIHRGRRDEETSGSSLRK